jgi:hypothetical protein
MYGGIACPQYPLLQSCKDELHSMCHMQQQNHIRDFTCWMPVYILVNVLHFIVKNEEKFSKKIHLYAVLIQGMCAKDDP